MLVSVDKDNSGTITMDELCLLMGQPLKDLGSWEDLKLPFDHIDANGSGGVSQVEVQVLFGKLKLTESMPDEKLGLLFREVDLDGTGEIDFDYFVQLFTKGEGSRAKS